MVRLKGRTVIKEGTKSDYFFGSCFIIQKDKIKEMEVLSIKIEGFQKGFIVNFEITQSFIHNEQTPKEVKYVFPNDLKICIYDTTFVVGDEIIKPELKMKEEAEDTYEEAIKTGHAVVYGTNIGYSLTEFKLGNLPAKTPIKVILKVAFTGQIKDSKTFFVKFPLDVYTQAGSKGSLYNKTTDFSFTLQGEKEKIRKISSNFENFEFDEISKIFSLHNSSTSQNENKSILLTFECIENIESSALLSTTSRTSKYDSCSLTISPKLQATEDKNCEFIFVVDCSGSMGGKPIERASECLEIFIKSLPPKSFFNVIRFGSRFIKLFKQSESYTDEKAEEAIELARNLSSDLGGTDILSPLKSIYKEEIKHGQRQIFIITDGEVNNPTQVFELVSQNSNKNRCFTIGLGRFCDAGLVEGIANFSGGQSDFVIENDSISEKVIPQLKASFDQSFYNIEVHIANNDTFEVSPYPIKPIVFNGSGIVYIRTEKKENSFKEGILIDGIFGQSPYEFSIETIEKVEDVEEDQFGCSGGKNIGKAILPLFSFNLLREYEIKEEITDEEKQKAIELSISSGVLCKFTAFVGMSYYVYQYYDSGTARGSTGGRSIQTARRATGGKIQSKNKRKISASTSKTRNDDDDDESFNVEYSLLNLARYQKISGNWDNLDLINKMLELDVKQIDGIEISDSKIRESCIATILAIAALHVKSLNEKNSWILIEQKAINWLKNKLPDIDIGQIISKAEKLIH